jgi:SOS response regulatory protein OraA/RecX
VEDALRGRSGVRGRDEGELRLCLALAERRARAPLEALDERARARLARFLLGRGFAAEAVARVLRSPPGDAG